MAKHHRLEPETEITKHEVLQIDCGRFGTHNYCGRFTALLRTLRHRQKLPRKQLAPFRFAPQPWVSSTPTNYFHLVTYHRGRKPEKPLENESDRKPVWGLKGIIEVVFYNRMPTHQLISRESVHLNAMLTYVQFALIHQSYLITLSLSSTPSHVALPIPSLVQLRVNRQRQSAHRTSAKIKKLINRSFQLHLNDSTSEKESMALDLRNGRKGKY